jgi:hypothetical protein
MRTQIRLCVLAAAALSMASCGGGGDETAQREGPQIAKARLIERGDAICQRDMARVVAQFEAVPRARPSAKPGTILVPFLKINERAIRAGVKRIEALGRPSTDGDLLDAYLDERITAANRLHTAVTAAERNDEPALEAALKEYNRNQAQTAAMRFGFKVCGLGAVQRLR